MPGVEPATAEMVAAYNDGLSCAELEARFGMTTSRIHRRLKAAGVVLNGHKRPKPERAKYTTIDPEEVRDMYERGFSWSQMEAEFKVTRNTLSKALAKAGVVFSRGDKAPKAKVPPA